MCKTTQSYPLLLDLYTKLQMIIFSTVSHMYSLSFSGNQDMAVKYRERLYYFSTDESKAKFTANPREYTALEVPLKVGIREGKVV